MRRPVAVLVPVVVPILAMVVPLCVGGSAGAEPPSRSPALDAALGVPPEESPPLQGTIDPGYAEQKGTRAPDQTYGSTATTVGPDGTLINGLQITDPNVLQDYRNDIEPPQYHIVQTGDTLWDISEYYFHDPYLWPKVWSWNDHVTNAHWIFPGDRIRLYDPFAPQSPGTGRTEPGLAFSKTRTPSRVHQDPVLLTQTAFVDAEQFDTAMTVIGGGDAKVMMATLDTVYLDYDKANPPIPGERLVVYAPQEKVYDLEGKKVLGWLVDVMGDVEVETIARNAAEGTVSSAVNPIERGYKVGPLRRRFTRIDPVPADRANSGLVVATLNDTGPIAIKKPRRLRKEKGKGDNDVLAGEEQFVIVDLGEGDGVEVGNVLEVVRKGDEYTKKRDFQIPYEDGWPRRVIGALLVVQVLPDTSLAVSIYSRREFERGDHVELRGPGLDRDGTQADPGPAPTREGKTLETEGAVQRGNGKASGRAGVKIGQ
ncbi:LysM peptidoglycan-binding domain-containing protein [Paraliomyxa miuraensis]|uniref:LysM peptidoglycan-binding domain-containing protein n=1 Tax=Paraliomyxa miuraensis TaxID=376150 RepID=UPI00224DA333|nr:LysM peptidoglycan-binding domain-containing protein [Paraliomyxa miuraensis]MCX4241105.1 LysM peptidoglycan-binding domain-containing protein [Paraliomyxa miuraensis]